MNTEWLSDFRKIPDEVMNHLHRIAVRAVEDQPHSPKLITNVLGISRSGIYDWLRWYRAGGEAVLDTRAAPGADPVITPKMDRWLKATLLNSTPLDHGHATEPWTLGDPGGVAAAAIWGVGVGFDGGAALAPLGLEPPAAMLSATGAGPRGRRAFPAV